MNPPSSVKENTNIFQTPPQKRFCSPRSITRRPDLANFNKKKPSQIGEIKSSDRIRFISPSKANIFVGQDSMNVQNSVDFSYTQYSSNQNINYPFIKRCASPKHIQSVPISRRTSFCDKKSLNDNSFLSTVFEPSIQDFSNFSIMQDINTNNLLQQKNQDLKKKNFQLNLLVDEKNQFIEKQKQQYDLKLTGLTKELTEIKINVDVSQKKLTQTEEKISQYQSRIKQLQTLLFESSQKLDKAQKQIKMYKAKFRLNYNTKQKQDSKCKKYHQNCCNRQQQIYSAKSIKNQQNICIKQNALRQSKKFNSNSNIEAATSLTKVKSQKNLLAHEAATVQPEPSSVTSSLMKIHHNQQEFNEYMNFKVKIQKVMEQIRYKDIEILTLKRIKCEFQKQKQNHQKVKKFNKKLLARVDFLTKQCDNWDDRKRPSLPVIMTPKKKFVSQFEDFDEEQNEDEGYEAVQFELSPQRNFSQNQNLDKQRVFDEIMLN